MAIVSVKGQTGGGKKVVTGSLTGNGTETQTITGLTFEPTSAVIVLHGTTVAANMVLAASKIGGILYVALRSDGGLGYIAANCTFTYSAGTLSIYSGNAGYLFTSGKTYRYVLTE